LFFYNCTCCFLQLYLLFFYNRTCFFLQPNLFIFTTVPIAFYNRTWSFYICDSFL
jgi:hypothetical protein